MPSRRKRRASAGAEQLIDPTDRDRGAQTSVADLSPDLLVEIFACLGHDDLFQALQVCKVWAAAAAAPAADAPGALWHRRCLARGFGTAATPSSWRDAYRTAYQAGCYECGGATPRRTMGFAPLAVRLCPPCWAACAEAPTPGQRLIPKTQAKQRWCMTDGALAALPHAVDSNPINPGFAAMHLYRVKDVREAAVRAFGSVEAVGRERRRRLARR